MTTTFRTRSRRHHDAHTTHFPTYSTSPTCPLPLDESSPLMGAAALPALRLRLLVTSSTTPVRRTNDGFYAAPAEVALSGNLRAGFCCGNYALSHEFLGGLGLGIRDAWNRAAANMLDAESDHQGVAVQTRPLSCLTGRHLPGVQIRFSHSSPTAWLAHPQLFATLFHHLSRILGEEACFYAPSDGLLIAAGLSDDRIGVESWLVEELQPRLACRIYYRRGFPTTRGGSGGLPHEGLLSSDYLAELRDRRRAHRRTRWDVDAGDGTCGEYVTQADYDGQDHQHAA